jgi:hypothetical protein
MLSTSETPPAVQTCRAPSGGQCRYPACTCYDLKPAQKDRACGLTERNPDNG